MCVAAPGKVIELKDGTAKIEYSSNITTANAGIVNCKVGDLVLVHAGLIIQVLPQNDADYMVELFKDLEELSK